jgi:hypothetical protein
MGRRPKLTDHQKREAMKRKAAGEARRDIARPYNVAHSRSLGFMSRPFDGPGAEG